MQDVFGYQVDEALDSVEALRADARAPSEIVRNKVIDHIDPLAERFIAASPLAFVSSLRPDGVLDMTPRGDPAGFVHVLDPKTLALPDRPGNFRMDLFENVIDNGAVGLIFVIPGIRDTLRVSGTGRLVRDAALGERLAVNGKPAQHILLIRVNRVMGHCPKAFIRGRIWEPEAWPDTSDVPSVAEMVKAHAELPHPIEELEEIVRVSNTERLY